MTTDTGTRSSRPPDSGSDGRSGVVPGPALDGASGPGATGRGAETGGAETGAGEAPVDVGRIERAVREILVAIGEDPDRDGLLETPKRVARMYAEIFSGLHEEPGDHLQVTFEAGHDEMVMVRDIPLYSVCEHHLVPWFGRAHVAYIPNDDGRITGLSKLARLVDGFARRPQVQERLTTQVAEAIEQVLSPKGVLVVVEAEHLCMSMRGIRKPGSTTVTSAVRGHFRRSVAARAEAMSFVRSR